MDLLPDFFIRLFSSQKLLFLSFDHHLLGGNVFSEFDGVSVELILLLFLLLGSILGISYHFLHLEDLVSLLEVVVLNRNLLFFEALVPVLDGFESLFLFLLDLTLLFVFFDQVTQDLVLIQNRVLLLLSLQVSDLDLDFADLLPLLFFVLPRVLHVLVALTNLLLQLGNLIHLIVCHSESSTVIGSLFEDLRDKLLALLYQLFLTVV